MEECYGINRQELMEERYKIYSLFEVIKSSIPFLPAGNLRKKAEKAMLKMLDDKHPFAGMLRYFDPFI